MSAPIIDEKQFLTIAMAVWKTGLAHVQHPQQAVDLGLFGLEVERRAKLLSAPPPAPASAPPPAPASAPTSAPTESEVPQ
jgi:hypothetical protein